jgi:SOS-response transcriptional repressor LexA
VTEAQARMLSAIQRLTVDGVSPSYQELMDDQGLHSKSNVSRIIHALHAQGRIQFCARSSRTIEVIRPLGYTKPALTPDIAAQASMKAMRAARDTGKGLTTSDLVKAISDAWSAM